ncbi:hypothetical protein F0562_032854 [Nyssa sinensis]|uniref:Thioredoxin domain-containing protein n=1 Tax=Nyssa sinensis TaxID=561372 RepID=A0A5J5ARV5_9ASTE|nr:hypothetical protein F0562_032854 [Nyssa sinensis]
MGADFSALNQANRSTKTSQVLAFHSSTEWRTYFESKKATRKLIVIDFKASWCQPCQFMEPIFNNLAAQYKDVEFVQIDVDELMTVAQELGVEAIPTFILLKEGNEVAKIVGPNKEELRQKIELHRA